LLLNKYSGFRDTFITTRPLSPLCEDKITSCRKQRGIESAFDYRFGREASVFDGRLKSAPKVFWIAMHFSDVSNILFISLLESHDVKVMIVSAMSNLPNKRNFIHLCLDSSGRYFRRACMCFCADIAKRSERSLMRSLVQTCESRLARST